jgi:hypothetical protein
MKNYFRYTVILLVLFISYNLSFTQNETKRADNSLNHRIIKAYEDGKMDYQAMIKNRVYALTDVSKVDPQFRTDTPNIEKCGTTNILELNEAIHNLAAKNSISSDVVNAFEGILTRPLKQKYFVSTSQKFRIQYDTSGTHAVYQPTVDTNPADGVPDYVNRVAEAFDYIHRLEVDTMGYTPPPPDGTSGGGTNQYDVYLHVNSGAYGVTYSDGTVSNYGTPPRTAYKSYIHIDPTYYGFGYTDVTLPMKVTAAHEYFHAIQFAYNIYAGNWFMEVSSTWIEDIIYDDINDYRYYLSTFFNSPKTSLTKFDGAHEYASCIYGHYISENFGNNRMKRMWDYTVNAGSNIALNAIQSALAEIGTNRSDVFTGFTVWNYLTGSRANGTHPTYSEGSFFPQINIAATYSTYPVSATAPTGLEYLGSFYYHFTPIASPSNLKLGFNQISSSSWKGKVVVDSLSRFKSFDVDLSTGIGSANLQSFNNKTRAVFIPSNVATTGTNLSYTYSANALLLPTVFTPNGGESLTSESIYNITWTSTGITNLKIEYSTNNGVNWATVAASVPATPASFAWAIPNTPTTQALIRISSTVDLNLFDISNNSFTIQNTPTISIITPNGGEVFPLGFARNIEWSSVNAPGDVKIELSLDGGKGYETIFSSTSNDGTEQWTPDGSLTEIGKIRISSISAPSIYDTSESYFYIRNATLTVIKPKGGEVERIDIIDTIKWNSSNIIGNVKIQLSRDGGTTFYDIISNTENDGQEIWAYSGPTTNNARMRVISLYNNSILDESDSDFWILPSDFIAIQSPLGKESWEVDSTYEIRWISLGTSGSVKIELSRDGGTTYEELFNSTLDDGIENWIPNLPLSVEVKLKISDVINPTISFVSDNFLIGVKDTIYHKEGWNLLSLASMVIDNSKSYILPGAVSNVFLYDAGYVSVDNIQNGIGYWVKFSSDSYNLIICAPYSSDSIQVKAGWNLIGGLSSPVSISQITTEPNGIIASEFYSYDNGYNVATSLLPWKGYWVKFNQAGKLILTSLMNK